MLELTMVCYDLDIHRTHLTAWYSFSLSTDRKREGKWAVLCLIQYAVGSISTGSHPTPPTWPLPGVEERIWLAHETQTHWLHQETAFLSHSWSLSTWLLSRNLKYKTCSRLARGRWHIVFHSDVHRIASSKYTKCLTSIHVWNIDWLW